MSLLTDKAGNDPFKDLTKREKEDAGQTKKKSGGFQSMGIHPPIFRGIHKIGYKVPTPIQRKCIPLIMSGQDLVAMARTGSGKTAAFLIPLLHRLKEHKTSVGARGVILSPTRELAMQTLTFCQKIGKFTDLRSCLIVGGDSIENQFTKLAANPDIIIATPGRLRHLLAEVEKFSLKTVEYLVFDEGDRLFEMGFQEDIQEILNKCSLSRQTLIFSATLPSLLVSFARAGLNNPAIIRLDAESQLSENLEMEFFTLRNKEKDTALLYLLKEFIPEGKQILVFAATKHHVEYLHGLLSAMYSAPIGVCIYGRMDQSARKINLAKFAKKLAHVMFVTDLAARGIDIPLLDVVINYDFPPKPKLFVHRVGRVARAGRSGVAYSLLAKSEMPYVLDLMLYLGKKLVGPLENVPNDEKVVRFGSFPRPILEDLFDAVSTLLSQNLELQNLQKSMTNAYQLYYKTRNPASRASAKRTKDFDYEHVHVLLKHLVDESEEKRQQLLAELKTFRPTQTIFEQQEAPQNSYLAMEAKRRAHMDTIEKEKIKIIKKAKRKNLQNVPKETEDTNSEVSNKISELNLAEVIVQKFRDETYYLNTTPKNHYTEKGLEIEKDANAPIEELVLDLIPDDSKSIFRKRTITTWDKKKKNYVTNSGNRFTKKGGRVKTESGQSMTKSEPGHIYQAWLKKSKREIGKTGEEEADTSLAMYQSDKQHSKFRHHKNKKVKTQDELKTEDQTRKERKIKQRKIDIMQGKRKRQSGGEGPRKKPRTGRSYKK